MYKIIGADQKEYGPVTAEQLRQWFGEGRVNGQTLVRPESETDWRPLSSVPEFADLLRSAPLPSSAPFTSAPGATVAPPIETVLARAFNLDIGACISRSWELLK